jgi:hypothetical protein
VSADSVCLSIRVAKDCICARPVGLGWRSIRSSISGGPASRVKAAKFEQSLTKCARGYPAAPVKVEAGRELARSVAPPRSLFKDLNLDLRKFWQPSLGLASNPTYRLTEHRLAPGEKANDEQPRLSLDRDRNSGVRNMRANQRKEPHISGKEQACPGCVKPIQET